MSARQLVVLGTSSQVPTRYRAHNSYALRWDDQLILFDPGEGTQRQCTLAGVAIARATAVCITHFHGDHCLGLPGVIQRRSLDNGASLAGLPELPVFFPADGHEYFDRMRHASIFHDSSGVRPEPIAAAGTVATLGECELQVAALDHRATTFGYRLQAPDRLRVRRDQIEARGISGSDVGRLLREGRLDTPDGVVSAEEVTEVRRGQSMAFIMDTVPCDGAVELARDVDLLVCESTYLESERHLAEEYRHMTARQAAELAASAGARRLVLTHFSSRYTTDEPFLEEAGAIHDDVVVATDLLRVDVPRRLTPA